MRLVKVFRTQKGRRTNNDRLFGLLENTLDRPRKHEVWGRVYVCIEYMRMNPIIIPRHLYLKILLFTQFEIWHWSDSLNFLAFVWIVLDILM